MQELIAQAKQLDGLEQLHLSALTTNLAARRLYQSFGFEVYATAPRVIKFGEQYLDESLMMFYLRLSIPTFCGRNLSIYLGRCCPGGSCLRPLV
jgi:hypothetical protein